MLKPHNRGQQLSGVGAGMLARRICLSVLLVGATVPHAAYAQDTPVLPEADDRKPPPQRVTVAAHFATLPDFSLPCGDLELEYDRALSKHLPAGEQQALQEAFDKHQSATRKLKPLRAAMQKATVDLTRAAYAYYRANSIEQLPSTVAVRSFSYQQYLWYVRMMQLAQLEQERIRSLGDFYAKLAPVYVLTDLDRQQQILDAVAERTDCLALERQKAFLAMAKAERKVADEVPVSGKQSGTWSRAKASDFASQMADLSANTLLYSLLVAELTQQVSQYGSFARTYAQARENVSLHDVNYRLQKREGLALGPQDPFPAHTNARRARMQVSNARARSALAYLYLQDAAAEMAYFKQLNVASGVLGVPALFDAAENLYKDVVATDDIGDVIISPAEWNARWAQDATTMTLSVMAAAMKFLGSTVATILTGPAQDILIMRAKPVAQFVGWDLKTGAEFALKKFEEKSQESERRIKLLQLMIKNHSEDGGFAHGERLIEAIAGSTAAANDANANTEKSVATQAPDTFNGLLEDDAFISGSGGGLAWVLEPFAESPRQHAQILFHGARHQLTGSARSAWLRIAADRGISVEDPGAPFNELSRRAPSKRELGLSDDAWPITELTVRYGTWLASGAGRSEAASTLTLGLSDLLSYEAKNRPTQDAFLDELLMQQALFDGVLTALKAADYDFMKLARDDWNAYRKHTLLLTSNPEYVNAYRAYREGLRERVKLLVHVRNLDADDRLSPRGKIHLGALDKSQQLELTDLAATAAWLNLKYHAYSINYLAAAKSIAALQKAENARRKVHGDGAPVDLTTHATAFRREARLSATTVAYQDLLSEMVKQAAMQAAVNRLASASLGSLSDEFSAALIARESQQKTFGAFVWEQVNPWAGKFSRAGLMGVAEGGALDASVSAVAQGAAKASNLFSYEQWNSGLGLVANFAKNVRDERADRLAAIADYEAERQEVAVRLRALDSLDDSIDSLRQRRIDTVDNLNDAVATGDERKIRFAREQVEAEIASADKSWEVVRARLLRAGLQRAMEVDRRNREEERAALNAGPIAEIIAAKSRRRIARDADSADSAEVEQGARLAAGKEYKSLLNEGAPTARDLQRMLDPTDPASLKQQILTSGLDIQSIREGLKTARARAAQRGDTAESERVDQVARDIDQFRIDLVNAYLDDFFTSNPNYKELAVAVVQGGAAKGNPEYQGIYADIDFTVLTREGVTGEQIDELKTALQTYFEESGYPLATADTEGYSPMDTEAFAQPLGRFDSSRESRMSSLNDTVIKMADATRFYSEGGGKWFINNMNYSGLKLWGDWPEKGEWVRVERHEAHGLAADMTRYMGFLTDPHYEAAVIEKMSAAEQRETLTSVLGKTKYFIRLIDAYLISHPRGNEIYNTERGGRKQKEGDDASYHWQIYVDAKKLIDDGHSTIFKPGDIEIIEWMARMKMKGRNPTPFDVIGDSEAGIQRGLRMVQRMQELAPDILARTAHLHYEESERIIASGSMEERRLLEADLQRKASTVRKVMESDGVGSAALMVPKATVSDDGVVTVLTEAAHRDEIERRMRAYRDVRTRMIVPKDDEVEVALERQPMADPIGRETQEDIATIIRRVLGEEALASVYYESEISNLEEDQNMGWFRYSWHLTDRLQKVAPLPDPGP